MAETSAKWDGSVLGHSVTYPAPYCTQPEARYVRGTTCLVDRTAQGPIYTLEAAYNGQLECTNPAGVQIQVDTGRANVNGWIYENDAAITLNPGAGNGFYRVVLQRDVALQTTIAALIYNAVATPTLTQVDGGVWEIPLANFEIAAGVITAAGVVDERDFVNAEVHRVFAPMSSAWNTTAGTNVEVSAVANAGFAFVDAAVVYGFGWFAVPSNYISGLSFTPVIVVSSAEVGANINVTNATSWYPCGQTGATTGTTGPINIAVAANQRLCLTQVTRTPAVTGTDDIVDLWVIRFGNDPGDTSVRTHYFKGWLVEYFGYKR